MIEDKHSYKLSQFTHIIFSLFSFCALFVFAFWWFNPSHIPHNFIGPQRIFDIALFALVSYVIWHSLIMEALSWLISSHIKDFHQMKPVPGLKVAFVTTIVPANEPLSLLHKCLPAMVKAKYPHDTWLLDESDNSEVKKICERYGVKHFSRFGREKYNTRTGKFTKTKGGNHNAWYDMYGDNYDIVAQVDTDFVPKSTFLTKTLGYFRDPTVAFVGTPQIYGNAQDSLVAQGASEQLYSFYGTILRGLSSMSMTLLIGANHIVRVAALKEVDHYSAHITEDLITGMKLHAKGWKSVYVPYPLAIGEGPFSWEAYFSQQMRWAYGCMDILFRYSFTLFKKMGFRGAVYYFLLQQHYFSGIAMALSSILLCLYFFGGIRVADIDLTQFLTFYSLILLLCWLMSVWLQRYNIYRKKDGELHLFGKLINIAAWPIWFLAFVSVITGKKLRYKVTPKGGDDEKNKTPLTIFIPHIFFGAIAVIALLSSFITHRQNSAMLFWAILSAALMLSIPFSFTIAHWFSLFQKIAVSVVHVLQQEKQFTLLKNSKKPVAHIQEALQETVHNRRKKIYISSQKWTVIQDTIFLSFVVITSFAFYIQKIGFYSDDWSFLGNFVVSHDRTLFGLIRTATTPNTFMRPLQNIYDALLYFIFGVHPLGYQLVNAGVFLGVILLLYFILRKLKLPRVIAVAVTILYALLPNYSTDRFWYAAFQVNLSMFFFLFSLYSGLRALSPSTVRVFTWKVLSIFTLVLSALSYEVALPLILINIILFLKPREKLRRVLHLDMSPQRNHAVFILGTVIAVIYMLAFKIKTTTRMGTFNYPGDIVHITTSIFQTNYDMLFMRLPYLWGKILSQYHNPMMFVITGILYVVIFWYLYSLVSKPWSDVPNASWMRNFFFVGIIIFFGGYTIFLSNNKVGFSPTGLDNRVAIAAAIGIAFSIIGAFGWILRILPEKVFKVTFCMLVAVLSAGGFLSLNYIASFWSTAYQKQQAVLSAVSHKMPSMPKTTTVLLDGVCPYIGPGVVFESQWDLKGALQARYGDPDLNADIVTPRLKVTHTDIQTQIYTFKANYPFKNIIIYNYKNNKIYPIHSIQDASVYFQKFNQDYNNNCPPASAGNGVSIF